MYQANPPDTGYISEAIDLLSAIWGSPESHNAQIEQAKLAQLQAELELERERKRRAAGALGFLTEPGPLGLPVGAWVGVAVLGGVLLYQRGGRRS